MIERPRVMLDASSEAWEEPPWPTAFELARLLPSSSWTLIGGLMVKLHAALAGLPSSRSTVDVDSALHLETNAVTFAQAAACLAHAGYVLDETTKHAYRFDRGEERVDVMCSDRQAIWKRPRYSGRPLFGVSGGTRALQQTIDVDIETVDGTLRLIVPSVRGALVLKGAAYRDDPRDRMRHAEDGVMLLACVDDPGDVLNGLSQRSRGRVRTLLRALDERATPWASQDPMVQALARESFDDLRGQLGT
ncbi:hypothetical protein [Agromyces mangrovi Wang et al. 2018]|uniref:hypothetical protein n=1 Tax=Agromyces mangrovi TaxID=1858653 RepID=UPI002572EED7|nr:hypothetical protein [Agromyces mangrovi]BDZ63530.1 hypothetical protein GCM10025877_04680 [Agromyces mangrovi]